MTTNRPMRCWLTMTMLALAACGGGGNGPGNRAPAANAGPDQNVTVGDTVTLDGTGSSDDDGDTLTYSWSLPTRPAGSAAVLSSTTAAQPTFVADLAGTYVASLTVNDGDLPSAANTVTITASAPNQAPTANAGTDQNVSTGAVVNLSGTASSDPDGDTLTYTWSLPTRPAGSTAALNNTAAAQPTFTADLAGTYVASLTVSDGDLSSAADTVTVTASAPNQTPTAQAGDNQVGSVGAVAAFNGGLSSDPEGTALTYQWTITLAPAGSGAALVNATSAAPSLTPDVDGTYRLSLTVSDGVNTSSADTVLLTTIWMLNTSDEAAAIFTNTDGSDVQVNVQGLDVVTVSGTDFFNVESTGMPNYQHTITAEDIDFLENFQPSTKFRMGGVLVNENQVVNFGHDIGYRNMLTCFNQTGGLGWFPPGPSCPTDQAYDVFFPVTPTAATATCYTRTNAIGMYRNGVAMFNWSDDQTYENGGVWHQLAAKFEVRDLDLCLSHATQDGAYHSHLDTNCLEEQMGEDGTGHSRIYGYAADGYPIYGPYHAAGVRAQSCWKTRDYDTPDPVTGCAVAKQRSCTLVDRTNPATGKINLSAAQQGPDTDEVVSSLAGDDYTVTSGYYFEDYYFDSTCAALGGENLDEHNGHDHDGLGYHYHQTETFPYNVGPEFAGRLHSNAMLSCNATPAISKPLPNEQAMMKLKRRDHRH